MESPVQIDRLAQRTAVAVSTISLPKAEHSSPKDNAVELPYRSHGPHSQRRSAKEGLPANGASFQGRRTFGDVGADGDSFDRTAIRGDAELGIETSAASARIDGRHGGAQNKEHRTEDAFRKSPRISIRLNLEPIFDSRIMKVPGFCRWIRPTFFFFLCWILCSAMAQQTPVPQHGSGSIVGTATDAEDDAIPGAAVVLDGGGASGRQKVTTNQNGLFLFSDVQPGASYHVTIHANGFVDWTSPAIQMPPGKYMDLGSVRLTILVAATTVTAALPPEEIATEQVHIAEKQRALGFLPAFYAVYVPHPVPLTPKLKFHLALRTATDSVTLLASAFIAGIDQASDRPNYAQGAKGYGQRFGVNYANTATDTLVGGAILPSILHQDPRYFYQGTGTTKSRILHAIRTPFVCKGDNGQWQPNFSSVGGYLASGAIANTYYPPSNRGPGLVFTTAGIDMSATIANAILQEFFVHKAKSDSGSLLKK